MSETKRCPYCAEEIQSAAVRCRYCRSRLMTFDTEHWHRSHPEARLGGVCAALAHALSIPLPAVRLAFVIFTIMLHIAPLVYAALWAIIPPQPGRESLLEQGLRAGLDWFGNQNRNQPPTSRPTP